MNRIARLLKWIFSAPEWSWLHEKNNEAPRYISIKSTPVKVMLWRREAKIRGVLWREIFNEILTKTVSSNILKNDYPKLWRGYKSTVKKLS